MRAYFNYFKLRVITNFQYRAAALAGMSTQLFFGFMYIMLYIALYESNKGVTAPMSLQNLVTYMWLGQAFFALTHPYQKDSDLLNMIKDGNLAYEIIRPQNFYFKFYVKMIASRLVNTLQRCFPIFIVGFLLPHPYKLGLPPTMGNFIIFFVAINLSMLLVTAFTILIHLIVMFTIDSRGVFSFYSVISEIFMGSVVPIPFLPKVVQQIAYILPFRYITDFPYRIYMGDITINSGITLLISSFIWIVIIILIGYLLSKVALRKAVIQGG